MAKVTTIEEKRLWEVCGAFRTITIVATVSDGYRMYQLAHIDDSGVRKIREWGVCPDLVEAIGIAMGHADEQWS